MSFSTYSQYADIESNKIVDVKIGPFQDEKAWSRDSKAALFEILQNKGHFYYFQNMFGCGTLAFLNSEVLYQALKSQH